MKHFAIAAAAAFAATFAHPALAEDRAPTAQERAAVEEALTELGYSGWTEIERNDDGYWSIDDARDAQGAAWDLKLSLDTFEVLERDLED